MMMGIGNKILDITETIKISFGATIIVGKSLTQHDIASTINASDPNPQAAHRGVAFSESIRWKLRIAAFILKDLASQCNSSHDYRMLYLVF